MIDPSFKKENPERDRVLKEISAEKFGADVLKFYQQIINSFDRSEWLQVF